jgi:putative colanic acid biosynthesis UDP-glucose lipid carrier transferase
MESRNVFILIVLFFVLDLVGINCAQALVYFFQSEKIGAGAFNYFLVLLNGTWFLSAALNKVYKNNNVQTGGRILFKSLIAFSFQVLFIGLCASFFKSLKISETLIVYSLIAELLALATVRLFIFITERSFQGLQRFKRKIAIVGHSEVTEKVAQYFLQNKVAFNFMGQFKSVNEQGVKDGSEIDTFKNTIKFAIQNHLDEVYTLISSASDPDLAAVIALAEQYCVKVRFIASFSELEKVEDLKYHLSTFYNGVPILTNSPEPLSSIRNRALKRLFDIAFSLLVIVFVLSWVIPLLAIMIKLESRGPVFFKQLRSGKNNKPFWCYKFRSMELNDSSNHLQAVKNDPRVTKLGAILRKTSIDELPQFFNVLFGSMSIVGPRPHMLSHTDQYRLIVERYMLRLFFKPGITGWAQVNGHRGETKDKEQMRNRVECDIWYIENWSIIKDIKIVYKTFLNAVQGDVNAY